MLLSATTLRTDYLTGIAASDSTSVDVLGRALARAEAAVAKYLGYPGTSPTWESTSYVLRLAARNLDRQQLTLPVAPVTAIASVYQDLDLAFGASTAVSSSDYEQESRDNGAVLHLLPNGTTSAWYTKARSIKVTLTAGYANEAAIPKSLADAVYRWVADWWLRRVNRHLGSMAQGQVNQSLRNLEAIPPDVEALLAPWRLLGVLGVS